MLLHAGEVAGLVDTYEYDYDHLDDVIERLHDTVGYPPKVNLTAQWDRAKVR